MAKRTSRKQASKYRPLARDERSPENSGRPGMERFFWWIFPTLAAVVVLTVLLPGEGVAWEGDGVLIEGPWLFLGVLWSMFVLRWRRAHPPSRPGAQVRFVFGPIDGVFLFLIGWIMIASLVAIRTGAPRPAMNMLWVWVAMGVAWFLFRQMLIHPIVLRALLTLGIALATAQASFGLYQFFIEMPSLRAEYEANPDAMLRESGLWYPEGSTERMLFEERLKSVEPMGTFALTNSLAGLLAPWTVLLLGMVLGCLVRRPGNQERFRWPIGLLRLAIPLIPLLLCLLLTKSRSAWLAVLLGSLAVVGVMLGKEGVRRFGLRRLFVAGAVLVVLVAVMVGVGVQMGGIDREIVTEAYKSLGYRAQYWQATMAMIADHPWFGCGPGNYQHVYTQYKLPTASEEIADPHNFLLHLWSTAGTPAAVAIVVILIALVVKTVRGGRDDKGLFEASDEASPNDSRSLGAMLPAQLGRLTGWIVAVAAGFFSALLISQSASVPLGMPVLLIGMPAAGFAFWLLWPMVRELEIPTWLLLAAVFVLFVHLSAAGGIHFPSVAISGWLLAAMVTRSNEWTGSGSTGERRFGEEQHERQSSDRHQRRLHGGVLATMLLLGGLFYYFEFYPVLKWRACQNAAMSTLDYQEQVARLRQAVEADPWAAETWMALAGMTPYAGGGSLSAEKAEELVTFYRNRALATAPHSAGIRRQFGEEALAHFLKRGDRRELEFAEKMFTEAIDRYPTSAALHGRSAVVLHLLNRHEAAREAKEKALELDRQTPHRDKKLTPELRERLESME